MKQVIRITEAKLRQMIKESITNVLNERYSSDGEYKEAAYRVYYHFPYIKYPERKPTKEYSNMGQGAELRNGCMWEYTAYSLRACMSYLRGSVSRQIKEHDAVMEYTIDDFIKHYKNRGIEIWVADTRNAFEDGYVEFVISVHQIKNAEKLELFKILY